MSMWEPFTESARRSIVLAQEEAQRLGNNYIGAAHVLLGILSEGNSAAAAVLQSLGAGASHVRRAVEELYGKGGQVVQGEMVFTPRAKRVIELGFEEARELQNNYFGTQHLVLALLRPDSGLDELFQKLKLDPETARERVLTEGTSSQETVGSIGREMQATRHFQRIGGPFSRVHHVQFAIPADGEAKARGFYADVLGMKEVEKPDSLKDRGGVWLTSGPVHVHLGVDPEFRPAQKAHVAFGCSDFTGLLVRLADANVAVRSAEANLPDGSRHVYVDDPFGNRIELVER